MKVLVYLWLLRHQSKGTHDWKVIKMMLVASTFKELKVLRMIFVEIHHVSIHPRLGIYYAFK